MLQRMFARARRFLSSAPVLILIALISAAIATAAAAPGMADESSYDVLTYSAWGRQNDLSGAQCTGLGPAGHTFLGATHASFRCQVQVGEAPAGVVVAKVQGPQSLRVTSISGGKLAADRGIGAVPKGTPSFLDIDAVSALQKSPWARTRRVARVLCYGVGPYRAAGTSSPRFFAFSCATFDARGTRGSQVLVTVAGKNVRVVRTLAK